MVLDHSLFPPPILEMCSNKAISGGVGEEKEKQSLLPLSDLFSVRTTSVKPKTSQLLSQ